VDVSHRSKLVHFLVSLLVFFFFVFVLFGRMCSVSSTEREIFFCGFECVIWSIKYASRHLTVYDECGDGSGFFFFLVGQAIQEVCNQVFSSI